MRLEFATCFEVDEELINQALEPAQSLSDALPRDKALALLRRMAKVSAPRQGAPRALTVAGRIAECEWLDGRLEVRLRTADEKTEMDLLVNDGLTLSRLHPTLVFSAPLVEFEQAAKKRPGALRPLVVQRANDVEMRLIVKATYKETAGKVASDLYETKPSDDVVPEILRKPTVRMKNVALPKEAYRDDDPPEGDSS